MGIDYRRELNDRQYEAVTSTEGPLLIIAGAGSGKTRVITFRMSYMLERGIPQASILALTFTNKAAREMAERVKHLTGKKLSNLTVSTFHAFGVKVLRSEIGRLGYRENFSIHDQADKISLIKETARELALPLENLDLYGLATLFSAIKTGMKTWDEATEIYEPLYREYLAHQKVYNAVDFDDLIALPITIFESMPEVLERYRRRFTYIMVDEFQDTSLLQYRFMKLLADGSRNVCVVGDDDQSIYSWRGANYENILNFERDFPEVKEIKLEQNYRSTGTILTAANQLIRNNSNRKDKELWTGVGEGRPIEIYFPEDERAEAEMIADTIGTLCLRERRKYSDFGILVRTNTLTGTIEEALLSHDIPCKVSGGSSFFERKEVKDVIAYLRVISNPDDDVNLLRVINTPRRGIGKRTLEIVGEIARRKSCSLYTAINAARHAADSPLSDRAKTDLEGFCGLLEEYRSRLLSGRKKMADAVRTLLEEIDYWGYLVQEHPTNEKVAKWRHRNVMLFSDFIEEWEKDPDNDDPNIYAYLNRITLASRDDVDEGGGRGKVNLMTIHSAKGLEFDVVFLAGVEDHLIPHARAIEENEANVEEERRLFYVAITRAREKLIVSSCRKRRSLRETIECSPSPFLNEMPPHLLEYREQETTVEQEEAADFFAGIKSRFT